MPLPSRHGLVLPTAPGTPAVPVLRPEGTPDPSLRGQPAPGCPEPAGRKRRRPQALSACGLPLWTEPGSNRRPKDFQSFALPAELSVLVVLNVRASALVVNVFCDAFP